MKNKKQQNHEKCNLVVDDHLLLPKHLRCHNEKERKQLWGYIGQILNNCDFRQIEKSAPSNIKHHIENSMFFYDRVNRLASRDLEPIFDTDVSRRVRWCHRTNLFHM